MIKKKIQNSKLKDRNNQGRVAKKVSTKKVPGAVEYASKKVRFFGNEKEFYEKNRTVTLYRSRLVSPLGFSSMVFSPQSANCKGCIILSHKIKHEW